MKIPILDARKLTLQRQGFYHSIFQNNKEGVLEMLLRLGYVQIDTISVVQRAHHHVIWSRVPAYEPDWIIDLQKEKKVYEYWSHAAAYLPMEHYRFCLPRMKRFAGGDSHWFKQDETARKQVLNYIKKNGPARSADFKRATPKKGEGWWDWKPTKKALEQLFMEGKLAVKERVNFQKLYDLSNNVLPENIDKKSPTEKQYVEFLAQQFIHAHGFGRPEEMAHLRKGMKPLVLKYLNSNKNYIKTIVNNIEYFTTEEMLDSIPKNDPDKKVYILSPFDNLVILRKRLKALFDFDYQIECYVPEPKRKYGYFTLPILYGTDFIGRMDCKADRKESIFYIKKLYLESDYKKPNAELTNSLKESIYQFSIFNNCKTIKILETFPKSFKRVLKF